MAHQTAAIFRPTKRQIYLTRNVAKMSPQTLILPQFNKHIGHFLPEKSTILELYSFQCTMQGNCKARDKQDLGRPQKGDYKPAYKKSQKTPDDQLEDMPSELAQIVAVWHDLPVHIKTAMTALVQTAIQGA